MLLVFAKAAKKELVELLVNVGLKRAESVETEDEGKDGDKEKDDDEDEDEDEDEDDGDEWEPDWNGGEPKYPLSYRRR
ncbi:hypothetical protein HDU90_003714 [Geranomyces variabilis]|nr:hypothetical protein HDU90_003714 [Geranomyces variabilis]